MLPQCFVSLRREPLPRWLEAFPLLTLHAPARLPQLLQQDALIWWEWDGENSAEAQIDALPTLGGPGRLVVLGSSSDDTLALRCLTRGARGFCNPHALAENLRVVAQVVEQGGIWIGQALMQRLIGLATQPGVIARLPAATPSARNALAELSPRQREVAQAIADGAQNKEIARRLGISERTVKAHATAIFEKLEVRDRLQLAIRLNQR